MGQDGQEAQPSPSRASPPPPRRTSGRRVRREQPLERTFGVSGKPPAGDEDGDVVAGSAAGACAARRHGKRCGAQGGGGVAVGGGDAADGCGDHRLLRQGRVSGRGGGRGVAGVSCT
mmetsp:Transcript_52012/g.138079  ORF Transcript_52012/g.138079 Transcript_52012/m.138079 type:complete len:117 (-) Transcript_52012:176-526(-)